MNFLEIRISDDEKMANLSSTWVRQRGRTARSSQGFLVLAALALTLAGCARGGGKESPDQSAKFAHSRAKLAHSYEFELSSAHTGKNYRIFVSVPDISPSGDGFPAIYLLDANAFFPLHALRARGLERRYEVTGVEPTVIVGIGYATDDFYEPEARAEDYTPPAETPPRDEDHRGRAYGGADRFLAFIEEELKPLLRAEIPLDRDRETLFGNSYGGLFVLHVLAHHPERFARYIASSPSIWWDEKRILRDLERALEQRAQGGRALPPLLLTVGSREQSEPSAGGEDPLALRDRNARFRMVDNARELTALLEAAGSPICHRVFEGEHHGDAVLRASLISLEFALGLPVAGCSFGAEGGD